VRPVRVGSETPLQAARNCAVRTAP
jgi:hypothetical protein